MITFENVTKHYNTNVGLENASVHIHKGDFVFLVGPSGAGKSTFIKLILKEINADSGSIKVAGREVTTMSNREVPELRRRIGIVFQDFRLLPKKTVYENVAFAMEILHKSKRQIRKKVPQVLSLVGISDKADKYPDELSAGEQQRVAIARAIINNPTVLIADEPTGNLDPDTASEIMDLLNQINLTGTTIVMVTHAKDIVDRMQKRVVAIEGGHIVRDEFGQYGFEEEGTSENVFAPESDTMSKRERRLSVRPAKKPAWETAPASQDATGTEADAEKTEKQEQTDRIETGPLEPEAVFQPSEAAEIEPAEESLPSEDIPAETEAEAAPAESASSEYDGPETVQPEEEQTGETMTEEAAEAAPAGNITADTIEIKAESLKEALAAAAAEEEAGDHE